MASYREFPRRGSALITRAAYLSSAAIAVGSLAGFLFLVFMGIVGEEVLYDFWSDGNWDPVFRAGVGATGITIALAVGLVVTFLSLSWHTFANQLARLDSPEDELTVPLPRDGFRKPHPFAPLFLFSMYFLIIDAVILLIMALALGETFRYNPESAWGEGVPVFVALAGLACLVVLLCVMANLVWKPQWTLATGIMTSRWASAQPLAESRLRAGIPERTIAVKKKPIGVRALKVAAISLAGSGVIFMIGVYIRQPGRRAAQRYYDEPGEALIDVLIGVSAVTTAIAMTVLVGALLMTFGAQIATLGRLRSIAEGRLIPQDRVDYRPLRGKAAVVELRETLGAPWPGQLAGSVLVGLGWGNAPFFAVTQQVVPGTWPDWLLSALLVTGAVGIVVLLWSDGAAARSRNRLLEAWG